MKTPDDTRPTAYESIRIRAVLVLICVSERLGRVCGTAERFEAAGPEQSVADARRAGWTFRSKAARCRACGNAGASFGKGK